MTQVPLESGELAPDFQLQSSDGELVHLYETLTNASVVLFFYVKAFTPVCMSEVCTFRDQAADFADLNANVYGISSDPQPVAQRFSRFHRLSFPILLDHDNHVRQLYRVPKMFGLFPGRSTYVVGQDRRIVKGIHTSLASSPHVIGSLKALRQATDK